MSVPVHSAISKGMRNTEHLWSRNMVKIMETACIENTNRIACATVNTLLHRDGSGQSLKLRTMTDLCDRHGKEVEEYQERQAKSVLQSYGWNPETGLLQEGATAPKGILPPLKEGQIKEASDSWIACLIPEINEKREGRARIPEESKKPYDVESPDEAVVEVCLDGVLSRRQSAHRSKGGKTKRVGQRPRVETSVAYIRVNGKRYILTAHDMRGLCVRTLAFLLQTGLLVNRQLILFSDGATEIRDCVDEIFSFCLHHIVLDWFHLRKHCYESLSMTLKSGKSNKEMRSQVMGNLMNILWVGNVAGAIEYLTELPSKDVKSEENRQKLIRYLQNKESVIACYAVRRRLGLRISSNAVEKANDLTVAKRQKHQGMSWSYHGSWHFAALTALYLNHEDETWRKSASLSFRMISVSPQKTVVPIAVVPSIQ